MSKVSKAISNLSLLLLNFTVIAGCSAFPLATREELAKAPDEREILFERAEQLQKSGDRKSAESLYYRITREPGGPSDPVYDKSLWNLAVYYEQADLPEKTLLALDELSKRRSGTISLTKIRMAQIKNHYRVTNYYQAQGVRAEIDRDYKSQLISPGELHEALYYTTTLYYDRHIADELIFLGEVQKYFFYIMESDLSPENEKLTELLIFYYDGFMNALEKPHLPADLKRQLVISLLDQLRKFDRYKIAGEKRNPMTIGRFSEYSDARQKKLTEWLTNDK